MGRLKKVTHGIWERSKEKCIKHILHFLYFIDEKRTRKVLCQRNVNFVIGWSSKVLFFIIMCQELFSIVD